MKRVSLWMLCLLLAACIPSAAQTVTGAVRGIVTDPSGAVVPGATMTATNTATAVKTTAITNQAGEYSIRFLQIGQYTLTVTATGFKDTNYGPFSLEIDQTAKIDIPLSMGTATTSVKVTEQLQPILNTESATLGETFTENTIKSIPLNGRDFGQLTMYTPGAVALNFGLIGSQSSIERAYPGGTASQANVNGNRQQQNNYLFDGQEISENTLNAIGYTPSPDALGQIRVIASNANAEFGNVAGGEVLMVMKGGTNQFHGSAFGFFENEKLQANSWSNDNNPVPTPKSPFTQTIFGGTIGGPIFKDKLFFFADYQKTRNHSAGAATYSVATAAMRTGDLSNLLTLGIQLYDTQTIVNGGPAPYADNQIPITNPVAIYLFNHPDAYPLPNNPTADPSGIFNNYLGRSSSEIFNQQGDIKIDWHLHENDTISARYSQGDAGNDNPTIVIPVAFSFLEDYPDNFFTFNWIHTFSSALVNSARASYGRMGTNHGSDLDPSGLFGLKGNSLVGITSAPQVAPGFSLQNLVSNGGFGAVSNVGTNQTPFLLTDNVFDYADNITWERGRHLFKFGAQFLRYQQNYYYSGNNGDLGQFNYTGGYTSNPLAGSSQPGSPFADFMLDRSNQVLIGATHGEVGQRQWRDAFFAQDDFKIMPNLTLNLGVRYEYNQPIYEVNNKEANVNSQGAIELAGVNGASRALYNATYDQVMPRLGFAYQPKPRIVIRGGYGITSFLEGTGTNTRLTQNAPFHVNFQENGINPTGTDPASYSPGVFYTVVEGFPTTPPPTTQFNVWPNLKPAITQEISLTTEYELNQTTSVQVGYVGILGHHLIIPVYGNQLTSPTATAPYANIVGQTGSVFFTSTEGNSNYNALQAVYRQRVTSGLELTANYTLAKSLTDSAGFFGVENSTSNGVPMNTYDVHADYGPSASDVRHSLSVIGVYNLPFGRGQRFGSDWNYVVDSALGGWVLSGGSVTYSGFPFTVSSPNHYSNLVNAIGEARPVQNRPLVVSNRSLNAYYGTQVQGTSCGPNQNNGTCVYSQEPNTGFGTLGVGTLRAPGFNDIDMAVQKNFALWRSNAILFRADFFNAFNIASYSPPDNVMTDPNFGQITSTRSAPRQVQLQLKYSF